ncbi:hypothetical protein BpHYR1_029511 [Brachionus plicatilis]|uniref:Uncharacterized protein n=1 Tax=Brachionus plicatilis TaxID=10195 RepID=A0A3M7RP83_BRAPC|nr:hypothetical protein BpHYR1_029511 [Brachionus plicatilis]
MRTNLLMYCFLFIDRKDLELIGKEKNILFKITKNDFWFCIFKSRASLAEFKIENEKAKTAFKKIAEELGFKDTNKKLDELKDMLKEHPNNKI